MCCSTLCSISDVAYLSAHSLWPATGSNDSPCNIVSKAIAAVTAYCLILEIMQHCLVSRHLEECACDIKAAVSRLALGAAAQFD